MKTNINTKANKALYKAGQKLIKSAYDFWEIHQEYCGKSAVVWLDDDQNTGHFVLFTRGEYKKDILCAAGLATKFQAHLKQPFTQQKTNKTIVNK